MLSVKAVTINLMVDKSRNRVVFADCGGDFVDILLSFLTLPMSSIIQLVGKDFPFASIHNLYDSVNNLGSHYYCSEACKSMLLKPIDIAATELRSSLPIRFEIDSKGHFCLFYCYRCFSYIQEYSLYGGAKCCSCGENMMHEIRFAYAATVGQNDCGSGVFVRCGFGFRYIITDDCVIRKASTDVVIDLLRQLDISVRSNLVERTVHVNASHVHSFLKSCLVSDTSLTDVFLSAKVESTELHKARQHFTTPRTSQANAMSESISAKDMIKVKLLLKKIDNKIIHAEVNEEFVNLLFSFLSYPAGYIIKLFSGQMNMMGSLGNIHKSIETLSLADCFKSRKAENVILTSPPFFFLKNGLMKAEDRDHPRTTGNCQNCHAICLTNPMFFPSSETYRAYLKHSAYIVNDDLSTRPLSPISVASSYLKNEEEEGVETTIVEVGEEQALALLHASITSKTALTDALLGNKRGTRG